MFDGGNIWVLIPLAAILIGGFSEYLKFKAKQQKLGDSTKETENRLEAINDRLEKQNRDLVRRIQNLEAIVTSQTWDDIHGFPDRLTGRDKPVTGDHLRASTGGETERRAADAIQTDAGRIEAPRTDTGRSEPLLDDVLETDRDDASDEQRAEQLARRLRNQ